MFDFLRRKKALAPSVQPGAAKQSKNRPLSGFNLWLVKLQVNGALRMRIYEKLGKFVANGVPITQALEEIQLHMSHDGKKPKAAAALAINEWRRAVLNGHSFSRALRGWAPQDELSVLDAGEVSGRFDRAIEDVIFVYSAGKRIRASLMGLMYPLLLVGTTCMYLYIFGAKVVPAFAMVLPVEKWQGTGKSLVGLAKFVNTGLVPALLGFALLIALIVSTFGRWTGRVRQLFDRIPPWTVYRLVIGSGFLISLGALLNAGVSVPEALRVIAKNAGPWYRERLLATRMQVLNGSRNIGDALNKTGFNFPSWDIVVDIRSYAALDGFEDMLDKLSRQWLDESVKQIAGQINVLRNVAIILLAVVFMWVAAGMTDLQQQISAAAN